MSFLRRLQRRPGVWLLPLAGSLIACSSQVEGDYRGEPIATLRGAVSADAELDAVPDVNVAVVFYASVESGETRLIGERIDVTESLPASFTLNLYAAPPARVEAKFPTSLCKDGEGIDSIDGAIISNGGDEETCEGTFIPEGTGVGLWHGYLAAIRAGAPDGELQLDDIIGVDLEHILLYYDFATDDPLPAMPTKKQLASRYMLITLSSGAPLEHDAGYLLLKRNPAREAAVRRVEECEWEGLCVHWLQWPGADQELAQARFDWEFAKCQEAYPENLTCAARRAPDSNSWTDAEPASSVGCRAADEAIDRSHCQYTNSERLEPTYLKSTGDGLDDPITIQLGATLWDMRY